MQGMEEEPNRSKHDHDSIRVKRANHFYRHALAYGLATVVGIGVGTYAWVQHEKGGGSKTAAPEAQLPGQSFLDILNSTQGKKRSMPVVLADYDLAQIIDGTYPKGANSAETVSVSAQCVSPSGRTSPAKPISRVIFRNHGGHTGAFHAAYMTPEHIAKTESLRTTYLEQRVKSGYVVRKPVDFSNSEQQQIIGLMQGELCGEEATASNPVITSHDLVISSAVYNGNPSYDPNNGSDTVDTGKALLGGAGLVLAIGLIAGGTMLSNRRNSGSDSSHE